MTGAWVRPDGAGSEPRWGHVDGLQVGLAPLPGPRGLLRIYAPHVGSTAPRVLNFVAVEPVPAGSSTRGYSELETSSLDGQPGKVMWAVDEFRADPGEEGRDFQVDAPTPGIVEQQDGTGRLRVRVRVERFDNGAAVDVGVEFRSDRPYEVGLTAQARDGSAPLDYCILSATMGNYARLRELRLADRSATPAELWPGFGGPDFAPHARFPLDQLARNPDGDVVVSACPDERDPGSAEHADGTAAHWRYTGELAQQSWRIPDPHPQLEVLVNARATYWASTSLIPGGPAFENVEVVQPYAPGRVHVFEVERVPDTRQRPE